jgi:hypothetical protein
MRQKMCRHALSMQRGAVALCQTVASLSLQPDDRDDRALLEPRKRTFNICTTCSFSSSVSLLQRSPERWRRTFSCWIEFTRSCKMPAAASNAGAPVSKRPVGASCARIRYNIARQSTSTRFISRFSCADSDFYQQRLKVRNCLEIALLGYCTGPCHRGRAAALPLARTRLTRAFHFPRFFFCRHGNRS